MLGDKNSRGCCYRFSALAARDGLASRLPGLWPDERLHDLQLDSHHSGRRHDRCLRDFPVDDRHHPGSRPDSRPPTHPSDDRSCGSPLGRDRANRYRHNSHHLRRPRRRSRRSLSNHNPHRLDNRCSHMPDQRSRARTRLHTDRKRSPEAVRPQGSPGPLSVCVDDTFRSLPPPSAVDRQLLVEQDQSVQFVVADCAQTAAISWHLGGNFAVTVVAPWQARRRSPHRRCRISALLAGLARPVRDVRRRAHLLGPARMPAGSGPATRRGPSQSDPSAMRPAPRSHWANRRITHFAGA